MVVEFLAILMTIFTITDRNKNSRTLSFFLKLQYQSVKSEEELLSLRRKNSK
jgi:hypothetical protein